MKSFRCYSKVDACIQNVQIDFVVVLWIAK